MDPESYAKWCYSSDFSWKSKDTLNGIIYSVRFVPKEYDIATCAIRHCEDKNVLMTDLNTKTDTYNFLLDLICLDFSKDLFSYPSRTGMNGSERKLYLNNRIKEDIIGVSNTNDTIKCVSVIYEAGVPNRARLLFELEHTDKTLTKIVLNDHMINSSVIEFEIPELSKKNIPTLSLKNYE